MLGLPQTGCWHGLARGSSLQFSMEAAMLACDVYMVGVPLQMVLIDHGQVKGPHSMP